MKRLTKLHTLLLDKVDWDDTTPTSVNAKSETNYPRRVSKNRGFESSSADVVHESSQDQYRVGTVLMWIACVAEVVAAGWLWWIARTASDSDTWLLWELILALPLLLGVVILVGGTLRTALSHRPLPRHTRLQRFVAASIGLVAFLSLFVP
jgi:hypothetical protein